MTYLLRFTNRHAEVFYFQNLGMPWRANDTRRLIERTTENRDRARVFATEEAARETLNTAGDPDGWEIVEVA